MRVCFRLSTILPLACALLLAACAPRFAAPLSESGGRFDGDTLVASDGRRLPLTKWLPEHGDVSAVIVAVHGFNDHSNAFEMAAALWQQHGIATFAYDQRGFGANPDHGHWAGEVQMAADLAAALQAARAAYPAKPLYVLGESMGGALVMQAESGRTGVTLPPVAGTILVAPAVWARRTMKIYERVALWFGARVFPGATFTGRGFGVQASDNIPMLRKLGRDPLFIKETRVDAIYGLVDLMDHALDATPRLRTPALVLFGAKDQLIPQDAQSLMVETLPAATRVALYPEGWHLLLRDLDATIVAEDVAGFILDRSHGLPSGDERSQADFVTALHH